MARSSVFALILSFLVLFVPLPVAPATEPDKEAEALIKAAITYRESFSYFKCRFRLLNHAMKDPEDLVAGKKKSDEGCDCVWIADGKKFRFQQIVDLTKWDELVKESAKKRIRELTIPYASLDNLSDGKRRIDYQRNVGIVNLYLEKELKDSGLPAYTPLAMDKLSRDEYFAPAQLYQRSKADGSIFYHTAPMQEVRGARCAVLVVGSKKTGKEFLRLSLDPAKGYMPVRIDVTYDSGQKGTAIVLESKKLSKDRWFPMRSVSYSPAMTVQGEWMYTGREIVVLDLEVDQRPIASDFRISLPTGTRVVHQTLTGPRPGYRLDHDEAVDLHDIDRLLEMGRNQ